MEISWNFVSPKNWEPCISQTEIVNLFYHPRCSHLVVGSCFKIKKYFFSARPIPQVRLMTGKPVPTCV